MADRASPACAAHTPNSQVGCLTRCAAGRESPSRRPSHRPCVAFFPPTMSFRRAIELDSASACKRLPVVLLGNGVFGRWQALVHLGCSVIGWPTGRRQALPRQPGQSVKAFACLTSSPSPHPARYPPATPDGLLGGCATLPLAAVGCLGAGHRPAGVLAAACHAVHNICRVPAHLAPPHVAGALAAARVLAAPALAVVQ